MLPKLSAYVKSSNGQTKWMYFLIESDDLLGKYNTICEKVRVDIKKKNLRASLSINKNFKTQIKITRFLWKKKKIWSGAKSNHTCLSLISLDSALKKDENYY